MLTHREISIYDLLKERGFVTLRRCLKEGIDIYALRSYCLQRGYDIKDAELNKAGTDYGNLEKGFRLIRRPDKRYIDGIELLPCSIKKTDFMNSKGEVCCGHYNNCYIWTELRSCEAGENAYNKYKSRRVRK